MIISLIHYLSLSLSSLAVIDGDKIDHPFSQEFSSSGYALMYLTGIIPKPYIAIIDGIIMGGVSLMA